MAEVTSRDGTRIAYSKFGSGPTLILVGGAGSYRANGPALEIAQALSSHFTAIAYDRRGRGESGDTQPYAVEREVEDLAAIIEAEGGSAFLQGFSSGAVLALQAAAHGLPIPKLALVEPPLETNPNAAPAGGDSDIAAEIEPLIKAGKRSEAVEAFHRGIGVPAEVTAQFKQSPGWAKMESVAHTFLYDLQITPSMNAGDLARIQTPTLVMYSQGSDDRLKQWANGVADALPNGRAKAVQGQWHGVATDVLVPELVAFFEV